MMAILLHTLSTGGLITLGVAIPIVVFFAMKEKRKDDNNRKSSSNTKK